MLIFVKIILNQSNDALKWSYIFKSVTLRDLTSIGQII